MSEDRCFADPILWYRQQGVCPASALPMPLPAIPSVEQVGKAIIAEARNWMDHGEAKHLAEPAVAWPNCDRAISANVEAALARHTRRRSKNFSGALVGAKHVEFLREINENCG
jgi:hypothetical protein